MEAEAARFSAGPKPARWQTGFTSVHSGPVTDGATTVAVAAFSFAPDDRPVQILQYKTGGWSVLTSLALPTGLGAADGLFLAADTPVSVGDVTGDAHPDFVIYLSAAGNTPGVVVSQDPNGWRYVPNAGPNPESDLMTGQPRIQDGHLVTTFDDCDPNCAAGHLARVMWTYQPTTGVFSAPAASGSGSAIGTGSAGNG